jgi:hypothetical protein
MDSEPQTTKTMDVTTTAITTTGGTLAPATFLDLPVEIRLEIYAYLLILPPYTKLQVLRPSTKLHASVLLVNRQINAEATPILYTKNLFIAHPVLLTSFSSLRRWYPPVREPSVLPRIRRFHIRVRLDCDPQYGVDDVNSAFMGIDELSVEVWQAAFLAARRDALARFEGVRGVKKVKIWGSTTGLEDYVSWLEVAMMSDPEAEVSCFVPGSQLVKA